MVGVVQLLQRHLPNAEFTWIIGKTEYALVRDLPGVRFIVFDKQGGWRAYREVMRQCRQSCFDVLLHMQVALRASLLSLGVRAKRRIGFDKVRAKDFQWLFTNEKIKALPNEHVVEGFLGFANKLGVTDRTVTWSMPVTDEAQAWAASKINSQQPVVIINPSASNPKRNWTVEGYATIATFALQQGAQVILTGGSSQAEKRFGESIIANMSMPPKNLIGKTTLPQLLALLKQASVLIAPDTGPVHMATTVGCPVIGLYACSNPKRTGPYNSQALTIDCYPQALQKAYNKTVKTAPWGKRVNAPNTMQLISIDAVKEKLKNVLAP